jgi:hypothetical protein
MEEFAEMVQVMTWLCFSKGTVIANSPWVRGICPGHGAGDSAGIEEVCLDAFVFETNLRIGMTHCPGKMTIPLALLAHS